AHSIGTPVLECFLAFYRLVVFIEATPDSSGSGGFWTDSNRACGTHEELSGSCAFRFHPPMCIYRYSVAREKLSVWQISSLGEVLDGGNTQECAAGCLEKT